MNKNISMTQTSYRKSKVFPRRFSFENISKESLVENSEKKRNRNKKVALFLTSVIIGSSIVVGLIFISIALSSLYSNFEFKSL